MMQIPLTIRDEDREKYLKGEKIIAAKKENESHIFNKYSEEVIQVIVSIEEIVSKQYKEVNGMVKGTFAYYMIQRKDV